MNEFLNELAVKIQSGYELQETDFNQLTQEIFKIIEKIPALRYKNRTEDDLEDLIGEGIRIYYYCVKNKAEEFNYASYIYVSLANYINGKLDRDITNISYLTVKSQLKKVVENLEKERKIASYKDRISDDSSKFENYANNLESIFALTDFSEYKNDFTRWTKNNLTRLGDIIVNILKKLNGYINVGDLANKLSVELGFDIGSFVEIAENYEKEAESHKPRAILSDSSLPNNIMIEIKEEISRFIKNVVFNFKNKREQNVKPQLWYSYKCKQMTLSQISKEMGWRRATNTDYYVKKYKINELYNFFVRKTLAEFEGIDLSGLFNFFSREFCMQLKKSISEISYEL